MSTSFGTWLRKSRELRALSLDEVAVATRLPPRILTALEGDDCAELADKAYAMKYARAVAEAIGLDPEDTALRYEEWRQTQLAPTLPPPPGTGLGLDQRLWARLRAVWRKLDPFVWAAIAVTLLVCLAMLLRR